MTKYDHAALIVHNTVAAEQSWRIREYGAQSVFEDLAAHHQKAIGAETFTADELRSAVIGALAAARSMARADEFHRTRPSIDTIRHLIQTPSDFR